jgi:hypothetical protein
VLKARTRYPVRIHSARPFGGDAPFTDSDLAKAVDNFNRYQRTGNPAFPNPKSIYIPAVDFPDADIGIGHEPDNLIAKLLTRSDLPALGKPVNLFMRGPDLFAELENIPANIGKMCDDGQFNEVSAEIYPNYQTPDGKFHGPVLRRVSLLGGWTARQKGLGGIPPMVYSFAEPIMRSGWRRNVPQQVVAIFSEKPFMDRTAAIAILQAAGIPVDGLDSTPDAFIVAIATLIQANGGTTGATAPTGGPEQAVQQFAERVILPQMRAMNNAVLAQVNAIRQESANALQRATEQEVLTFAETNKAKLFPFEVDAANPAYVVARLAKMLPDARKVEMAAIQARPDVRKFGEQMPGGTGQPGQTGGAGPMNAERKAQLLGFTSAGRARLQRQQQSITNGQNN